MTARCPICHDRGAPLPDGSCRRCAGRRLVLEVLSLVPPGTLAERVAAVADIAREALVEQALGAADGSRREAAKLLSTAKEAVAESRVTEAVRRYPWLGRAYKVARGRRPAILRSTAP